MANVMEDGLSIINNSKVEDRETACKEKLIPLLKKVDEFIATQGTNGHAVGDSMTIADMVIMGYCSNFIGGFF